MDLKKHIANNELRVRVIPNAPQQKIMETGQGLKVYLRSAPENGKANKELLAFLKKKFGLRFAIKSGEKSREKVLWVV